MHLEKLIHSYTREAGVRQLERKIGDICRKSAKEILETKKKRINITEKNLSRYLGKEIYTYQMANKEDEVGNRSRTGVDQCGRRYPSD